MSESVPNVPVTPITDPTAFVKGNTKSKGKGAAARGEINFRQKKNDQFQLELQASLLRRLGVSDPTTLNAINLQSSIIPARIPISFCGLIPFTEELWAKLQATGPSAFGRLDTPANYASFIKCVLNIAEAKVCHAQRNCTNDPPFDLPSKTVFDAIELSMLNDLARLLPYPLALFIESIGLFNADQQQVVPILSTSLSEAYPGLMNCAPSSIKSILLMFADPVISDDTTDAVALILSRLPMIRWVRDAAAGTIAATPETVQFWTQPISSSQCNGFKQVIAAFNFKPGFNVRVDITTGIGSAVQAIRFPTSITDLDNQALYYTNTDVSLFDEQLAPALRLGYEFNTRLYSRFCSTYAECLKHGIAGPSSSRTAVIWS